MKLTLKRVGEEPAPGELDYRPFGLFTESGEMLPCQASTSLYCEPDNIPQLTVVFNVDGRNVMIEGDY